VPFAGSSKFKLRLDSVVEQITHKRSHMQRCTTAQDTRTTGKSKKKNRNEQKKKIDIAYQTTLGGINDAI